jgi:hypothetical protein
MMDKTKTPPRGAFDYLLRDVDKTIWRDADLGDAPPAPPERGGGGPRVRVEIEIVQRPPAPRREWAINKVLFWVVAIMLIAGLLGSLHA